jgi:hypothetical protein
MSILIILTKKVLEDFYKMQFLGLQGKIAPGIILTYLAPDKLHVLGLSFNLVDDVRDGGCMMLEYSRIAPITNSPRYYSLCS